MPRTLGSQSDDDLRAAERMVTAELGGLPLDFQALAVVSNIFRAATASRSYLERTVLDEHELSWSAFVGLFVLRVWGELELRELAREVGVTPGTMSGVVDTLERRQLVKRVPHPTDGRRVIIRPLAAGRRTAESVVVRFNEQEAFITKELDAGERDELARLLRRVLRTLDEVDS